MNIKGQSFLKLLDFTPEQITDFLTLAADLKAKKKAGIPHRLCEGKQAALIMNRNQLCKVLSPKSSKTEQIALFRCA